MKLRIVLLILFLPLHASAQVMTLYGQMHHTAIEGGCWYLQAADGKRYELTGDSSIIAPLRIDGQHIGIRAERAKGASVCMVGELIRVIQRIDSVRYATDPLIMSFMVDGKVYKSVQGFWYVKTPKGRQYEFKTPPAKKYRHSGTHFHQASRVLLDQSYVHKKMEGLILPDGPPNTKGKNIPKKYDPR